VKPTVSVNHSGAVLYSDFRGRETDEKPFLFLAFVIILPFSD